VVAKVRIRNQLGAIQYGGITPLLWPLVQIKRFFDALYQTFSSLIWSGITGQSRIGGLLQVSGISLVFCGLSVIVFYLQAYEGYIFLVFAGIWWLDRQWAQWQYFRADKQAQIVLQISPKNCIYSVSISGGQPTPRPFRASQVKCILITHREIRGGMFESALGKVWEVAVQLRDSSCLRIYEEADPARAFRLARSLAEQFPQTVIKFAHSEGSSPHALRDPSFQLVERYRHRQVPALKMRTTPRGWQLRTRWSHLSMGFLLERLLERVGFLLFVLLLTEVMENFGALLHSSVSVYGDSEATRLLLIQAVQQINLSPDPPDLAEAAIALGLFISQVFEITQNRQITITPHYIDYRVSRRQIARVRLKTAQSPFIIHEPSPMVLILDKDSAIAIPGLASDELLYGTWVRIKEGLTTMRAYQPQPQKLPSP